MNESNDIFWFEGRKVEFVGTPENPEWIAQDVCDVLEIANPSQALSDFDDDEKGMKPRKSGGRSLLTVKEPGLYRLVLVSRKSVAKRFKKWVTGTVLPEIRKTGKYGGDKSAFNPYMTERIRIHHDVDFMPLPDGYFCLFDKMIEVLQKFDISIDYVMGEQWYDFRKGDKRFLEPDISLGQRFSSFFTSDFDKINSKYQSLHKERLSKPNRKKFWTKQLIDCKWSLEKAAEEKKLREKYFKSPLPIDPNEIDRRNYRFKPAPDSGRPEDLPPAFCYSNDYTSLFYEWLRDVFFKYAWKDYIEKRDPEGWILRYRKFQSLSEKRRNAIRQTAEGKMIEGYEYRNLWQKQLSPVSDLE
jgi:prophage antirepressor-like protein